MVVPVDSGNGVRKYVWDNVTTDFSYPYIIQDESLFASLYNDNGELVLSIPSTAYTLSDPTRSAGVLTITDSGVLATEADSIILERIEELDQELDLGKRDFPPQDIEDAFDKSRIIDQQQQSLSNRSVITNIVENRQEPIELPPAVENLFLAWDDEGNLKNATSTGTALPAVPNSYLRRNNDNTAFSSLTSSEVLDDINAQEKLAITQDNFITGTGAGIEEKTPSEVLNDIGAQGQLGYLHVVDQKANNVNGGGSTSGSYQTRELNTVLENSIAGASLSSNQITLPAGKYIIEARAPSLQSGLTKARFRNITDSTTDILGASNNVDISTFVIINSWVRGVVTINDSKSFELQHYVGNAVANRGWGSATNTGDAEIYSSVLITKIG